jgi:hypothetical protein
LRKPSRPRRYASTRHGRLPRRSRVARWPASEPGRARVHRSKGWAAQSGRFVRNCLKPTVVATNEVREVAVARLGRTQHGQLTTAWKEPQVDDPFVWRRLRGSNPRGSCPPTRFPGVCLRPLGQASAAQSSQPRHAPATNRGEGGLRRRLPQERGELLRRHPDPTQDARERASGPL